MTDDIKEILDYLKENDDKDVFGYVKDKLLAYEEGMKLLDYIINLQEQLHQASLDIQELTERDIWCPTNCDKLTNLQNENKESEEAVKYWQNQCDLRQRAIDKALDYIKEYGRDKQLEEEYLMNAYNLAMYNITLLEILGDKEDE